MLLTEHLATKAAQCRAWAIEMHHDVERSRLLAMAEQYDRLIWQIAAPDNHEVHERNSFSTHRALGVVARAGKPIGSRRVMNGRQRAAA